LHEGGFIAEGGNGVGTTSIVIARVFDLEVAGVHASSIQKAGVGSLEVALGAMRFKGKGGKRHRISERGAKKGRAASSFIIIIHHGMDLMPDR